MKLKNLILLLLSSISISNAQFNVNYDYQNLIEKAKQAREKAYCPYSNFKVGAAILTKTGEIFTGCNVENVAHVPGSCAERTAIVKSVSEGYKEFKAIAIIANTNGPCSPCGVCRQAILEFGIDTDVIMTNLKGEIKIKKIKDLVPYYFSPAELEFNKANPENIETKMEIKNEVLYKICLLKDFDGKAKEIKESELDKKSGFIHLSFGYQVQNTINKFFKDTNFILAEIDTNKLNGILKIESNKKGGQKYPHLYDLKSITKDSIINLIEYKK